MLSFLQSTGEAVTVFTFDFTDRSEDEVRRQKGSYAPINCMPLPGNGGNEEIFFVSLQNVTIVVQHLPTPVF